MISGSRDPYRPAGCANRKKAGVDLYRPDLLGLVDRFGWVHNSVLPFVPSLLLSIDSNAVFSCFLYIRGICVSEVWVRFFAVAPAVRTLCHFFLLFPLCTACISVMLSPHK